MDLDLWCEVAGWTWVFGVRLPVGPRFLDVRLPVGPRFLCVRLPFGTRFLVWGCPLDIGFWV